MKWRAYGNVLISLLAVVSGSQPAFAQSGDMEKLLDDVDRPGSWAPPPANHFASGSLNSQSSLNPASNLGSGLGASGNYATGRQSVFTPQNILRVLMGGTPQGTTTSGNFSGARGNVQQNLQTARDQASRAESACSRASSGNNREARMSAAEEARYAAQAAREAADRASSQSENTTGDISDSAAQARDAADRAQGAADRATANAEGGGW